MPYQPISASIAEQFKNIVGGENVVTDHDLLEKYAHDETEDCPAHLRQRQDRSHWCQSARGDLSSLRDDLPRAARFVTPIIIYPTLEAN